MIQFSDEQAMLLDTALDFCRNQSPIDTVRDRLDAEHIDREQWQQIVELGWLGINAPETSGGLGMGLSSVVPIVESMGRYLMGTPYSSTVLAIETLAANGSEAQQAEWLPRLAAGGIATMALTEADGGWNLKDIEARGFVDSGRVRLEGKKTFVTDADVADFLLASVQIDGAARFVLIETGALRVVERETVIDQTRRSFQVSLDGVEIDSGQVLSGADFERVEQAALLLLTAEAAGGLPSVLHLVVEYLNTRKAFGRTIGSYQALKHPASDILLSSEAARSHLYHAATLFDKDDVRAREAAVRMAKAQAVEAFAYAGDRAVQFHGGFGFTFECDAQLFLRRALWCQYQFGDERYHRQLLQPLLLDAAG